MSDPSKIYDVLIAGSGPAGLASALGLSRVKRTAALFTKTNGEGFRNEGVTEMHNVLSRDKMDPIAFRKISRDQIEQYGTTDFFEANLVKLRVKKLTFSRLNISTSADEDVEIEGFEVEDKEGRSWLGRKLILAMGSNEVFPDIKGYRQNWPENIYQCMFCDGHERSHLPGGVLGFDTPISAHIAQMVNLLRSENSGPVTIFTDGVKPGAEGMDDAFEIVGALGCKIVTEKILSLEPAQAPDVGVTVRLGDGQDIKVGYLGHKPATVLAGKEMIQSLGVAIDEHPTMGDTIKLVDVFGSTTMKGVFAAGDASTPLKAASNALASGATVAAGAVQQLVAEDLGLCLTDYRKNKEPPAAAMFN